MNRQVPKPSISSQSRVADDVWRKALVFRAHAVTAFFSRFFRTHYGFAGLAILALLVLIAIMAPLLAPFDPRRQVGESLMPPSRTYPMGTDNIGRDLFSLVLYGTRASLAIGFCAALAALLIGGTIGALAGYRRGLTEAVLMRLAELFQTLPVIIVVLFAIALFGSSFWLLIAAVALAIWPLEARLIYGQFINLREREFVSAAIVADLSTPHIVLREILPNALPPVIVQVALDASLAILIESGLGFPRPIRSEHDQLGAALVRGAGLPERGVVDERVPGPCDMHRHHRPQPFGGWAERGHKSARHARRDRIGGLMRRRHARTARRPAKGVKRLDP